LLSLDKLDLALDENEPQKSVNSSSSDVDIASTVNISCASDIVSLVGLANYYKGDISCKGQLSIAIVDGVWRQRLNLGVCCNVVNCSVAEFKVFCVLFIEVDIIVVCNVHCGHSKILRCIDAWNDDCLTVI
jgi:hypothetical protein